MRPDSLHAWDVVYAAGWLGTCSTPGPITPISMLLAYMGVYSAATGTECAAVCSRHLHARYIGQPRAGIVGTFSLSQFPLPSSVSVWYVVMIGLPLMSCICICIVSLWCCILMCAVVSHLRGGMKPRLCELLTSACSSASGMLANSHSACALNISVVFGI